MEPFAKALVCGLGGSGEAAARLLLAEGTRVTVIDAGRSEALRGRAAALTRLGARVVLGAEDLVDEPFDVGIVSPGIPDTSPWIAALKKRGTRVLPELELGWSRRRARTVAVTGSNGKSTCVKWLAESLREAGLRAEPASNYGPAVSKVVMDAGELDWLVLEVSSFQLETVEHFRPDVGVLLNIHPNHLDRHGDMATYTRLKARLFECAGDADACIVHEPLVAEIRRLSGGGGRWVSFGASATADYRYEAGRVTSGGDEVVDLTGTVFANDVLGEAGAAVAAALRACGVEAACAAAAAGKFVPLPHRMQAVGQVRGRRFINDSKATNLSAMAAALRMVPGRARLVAGGLSKEHDYGFVKDLLREKAAAVYLVGRAAEEMAGAWSDTVRCVVSGTLEAAVRKAFGESREGESILLSPACASFDQFRDYEERGARFAELVKVLAKEEKSR